VRLELSCFVDPSLFKLKILTFASCKTHFFAFICSEIAESISISSALSIFPVSNAC
jgi:hypothetical protein